MATLPDAGLLSHADTVALMAHGILVGGGFHALTKEEIVAEARAMAALLQPPQESKPATKWVGLSKSGLAGWQEHMEGGQMPLTDAKVEVRLRDGATFVDIAGKLNWAIQRTKGDIIQWRYVK